MVTQNGGAVISEQENITVKVHCFKVFLLCGDTEESEEKARERKASKLHAAAFSL